MIKVLDRAAIALIVPGESIEWVSDIIFNPQTLHYIDLNSLDGNEWVGILDCYDIIPNAEQLCTEHNGWAKMNSRNWKWLLQIRSNSHFEKYKPTSFNN